MRFSFKTKLWKYDGPASWYFLTLPKAVSKDIKEISENAGPRKGFGSVRVRVTIGQESWKTSVFPDSKSGTYLLPIKKSIRYENNLDDGSQVTAGIELADFR